MATNPPRHYGLGRLHVSDPRDARYPLRAITNPSLPQRTTPWQIGPILDQGANPWCVAYTCRAWLNAEPVRDPNEAAPDPATLYAGAQANDGMPMPHEGSSDRGMMKYLQSIGMVDSYHWAQSVDEAALYLLTTGPLMCGMAWHAAMFTPDSAGYVHPDGKVVGGHEFLCFWYDQARDDYWFQQSWGAGWGTVPGMPGVFTMHAADLRALFADNGDMCAAQEVIKPAPPPPPATDPAPRKRWRWFPFGGPVARPHTGGDA